jgi:hypothetical protein
VESPELRGEIKAAEPPLKSRGEFLRKAAEDCLTDSRGEVATNGLALWLDLSDTLPRSLNDTIAGRGSQGRPGSLVFRRSGYL